ncbi:hypothetical protein PINS_up003208 [Pythium insidiosum]|nr:hypothetical protein PINS_up003208 [Pythium insidiosum]
MHVNDLWRSVCRQSEVWRWFCTTRWKIEPVRDLLQLCGTEDICELYLYLDRNGLLPRGKYTMKHQLIWGKTRQEDTDVWLTIAHRPDCRLLTIQSRAFIQLRLVIQNLDHKPLTVDFKEMLIDWKDGVQSHILGSSASTVSLRQTPRLVAWNGLERDSTIDDLKLQLNWFDHAVVSINVECDDCEFEADFLERCSAIWLPIRRLGPCKNLSTLSMWSHS